MTSTERRYVPARELRVVSEDGEPPRLQGVGVWWNSLSLDLGDFREEFAPGAFSESIGSDDIRVQWQHDPKFVFGRTSAGTARVWEDEDGLRYMAEPPDAGWARDALVSIQRGDVSQNSFAFRVLDAADQRWEKRGGSLVRTVLRAKLIEVGPQTDPAYPDTTVALRSVPRELIQGAGLYPEIVRARRRRLAHVMRE